MSNQPEVPLRIVVVGGVAGGASAAARARRCNANAEITVLEKGPAVSFANCGLPYHIGGEIEKRSKLLVATAELFWERFRIRVRTGHEVTSIDRNAMTVTGKTVDGKEFKLPFDRLILATGSEPFRPPFLDTQTENVFQLWTLDDMDEIIAYMKNRPIKRAAVIGAGFVGLEVVEQLHRCDVSISVFERAPQVLTPLDGEMAKLVQRELEKNEVQVHVGANVESLLTSNQRATAVKLDNGESIAADLVIVGVGVRPRTQLAVSAGLDLGESGAVATNEFGQTNDPNIYAVGDMAEVHHGVLGRKSRVPLAGPANRAGRVAGTHSATGQSLALGAVQATAIVRVFDIGAGSTGLNERACKAEGMDYRIATIQAAHHASYFPGARSLTIKLIYSESGKILGAQAVGAEGVDKRLDVVSTILHFGGSVQDLSELDLAYAPPYGSAKDPLHMAAFVALNDLAGLPVLVPFDAELEGQQIVDVRKAPELVKLPLGEEATHMPVDELVERWEELDPDKPTVVVCHSGKRAHVAACWLQGKGFKSVRNLNGGVSIRSLK